MVIIIIIIIIMGVMYNLPRLLSALSQGCTRLTVAEGIIQMRYHGAWED